MAENCDRVPVEARHPMSGYCPPEGVAQLSPAPVGASSAGSMPNPRFSLFRLGKPYRTGGARRTARA